MKRTKIASPLLRTYLQPSEDFLEARAQDPVASASGDARRRHRLTHVLRTCLQGGKFEFKGDYYLPRNRQSLAPPSTYVVLMRIFPSMSLIISLLIAYHVGNDAPLTGLTASRAFSCLPHKHVRIEVRKASRSTHAIVRKEEGGQLALTLKRDEGGGRKSHLAPRSKLPPVQPPGHIVIIPLQTGAVDPATLCVSVSP